MAEVSKPTKVGQDLSELLGIDCLLVVGGLIPGFPGKLAHILTVMVDMVEISTKYLWVPIGWLFGTTQGSKPRGIG